MKGKYFRRTGINEIQADESFRLLEKNNTVKRKTEINQWIALS